MLGRRPNVVKLAAKRDFAGLAGAIAGEDPELRREAAQALAEVGDPACLVPLRPLLRPPGQPEALAVASRLAPPPLRWVIGASRASDNLVNGEMFDTTPGVARLALDSLAAASPGQLASGYAEGDEPHRLAAVMALAASNAPGASDELRRLTTEGDPDPRVTSWTVIALHGHDPVAALAAEASNALNREDLADAWLQIAGGLLGIGWIDDGLAVIEQAAAACERGGDLAAVASVRFTAGRALRALRPPDLAIEQLGKAIAAADGADDRTAAIARDELAGTYMSVGDYEAALVHSLAALEIWGRLGDRSAEAVCRNYVGMALRELGRPQEARVHLDVALACAREEELPRLEAAVIDNIGATALSLGHLEEAATAYADGLAIGRELGDDVSAAISAFGLASVHEASGEVDLARAGFAEAMGLFQRSGDPRWMEAEARGSALGGLAPDADGDICDECGQVIPLGETFVTAGNSKYHMRCSGLAGV